MKKTSALFEDTTMAYNRWTQGIASREQTATKVGLSDILDSKRSKSLEGQTQKDVPLHPLLTKSPEIIGSILIDLSNIDAKIRNALTSNLAQDPKKRQTLLQLLALVRHNNRMTRRMIKYFEKLS